MSLINVLTDFGLKQTLHFHRFQNGDPLSKLLRESLKSDPVNPILWEPHLAALDRRIVTVLDAIRKCVNKAEAPLQNEINDFVWPLLLRIKCDGTLRNGLTSWSVFVI